METTETPTHYDTLKVAHDATTKEIKVAYRAIMRTSHPDVAGDTPEAHAIATAASEAYSVLGDEAKRADYDAELLAPPEPVPDVSPQDFTDDWGETTDWEETEPEPVPEPEPTPPPHQEPGPGAPPPPRPAPSGPPNPDPTSSPAPAPAAERPPSWPPAQPDKIRLRSPSQAARTALVVAGFALVVLVVLAAVRTEGPAPIATNRLRVAVVLAGVVGGTVLAMFYRGKAFGSLMGWGMVALVGVLVEVLAPPALLSAVRLLPALMLGVVACTQVQSAMRRQREADRIVRRSALRKHNLFGTLPGGVAADLLDGDLRPLHDLRAARTMRCSQPQQPFSHVVSCGTKVAYLLAVIGPPGAYRWSGPSLLVTQPGQQYPTEVLRCDYPKVMANAMQAQKSKAQVRGWIVVYPNAPGSVVGESMGSHPTVSGAFTAMEDVKSYLGTDNDLSAVDQEAFVDAGTFLYA